MLATILGLLTSLWDAVGKIASLWQSQQQKQAGIDAAESATAKAEASAEAKVNKIAVEGQTDAQTKADLDSGAF